MSRKRSAAQIAADDQKLAASQRKFMNGAKATLGGEERWIGWGEVSSRFRAELLEICETNKVVFCPHIPFMPDDELRHVNAWSLTHVGCEHCTAVREVMLVTLTPEEDRRCDGCKVIFSDGLYPNVAVLGNIALHFGLCDDCRAKEHRKELGSL